MIVPGESFRFAGRQVRINWHHEELRTALRPAIAHRACPDGAPELTIDVLRAKRPEGMDGTEALQVLESRDGLAVIDTPGGLMSEINLDATRARFACAEPARLSVAERSAPFRLILQTMLRARGAHLLHAGAVGLPGGDAVLLAAPGGGGKSNTVLSCLAHSSLQVAGEDFVAVDVGARARVWSLYASAKLPAADLARFPALAAKVSAVRDGTDGKVALDLSHAHRERLGDGLPLRAILVLQIADAVGSRVIPAAPGEAVKAMLTSLLMVLPSARRPLFEFTTGLARKLPAYRLELGRDPAQVAGAIQEFLQRTP